MSSLTVTIQERMAHQREQEWRRAGVGESDIEFSRLSGMDARDVTTLRHVSRGGFLIVIRCPKHNARVWHGLLPAKPWAVKDKTGSSGVVVVEPDKDRPDLKKPFLGDAFVSDYDVMSIWKPGEKRLQKLFASEANGRSSGPLSQEASEFVRQLNKRLVTRIQHGAQDDYNSPHNPGVNSTSNFAAFRLGIAEHLANPTECKAFYQRLGLAWPYDEAGKHL
jgi:hypothetical protein